ETIPMTIKGEIILFNGIRTFCPVCKSNLYVESIHSENMEKGLQLYRKKHDLVSPLEIKEVRKLYDISQSLFSKILGIGEATIRRYETGMIPSKINSDTIKQARSPKAFMNFVEQNKENISPEDYEKVSAAVKNLLSDMDNKKQKSEIQQIHKSYDMQKIFYIIHYIIGFSSENDFIKILKLMWLIDYFYYKKNYRYFFSSQPEEKLPYKHIFEEKLLFIVAFLGQNKEFEVKMLENDDAALKIFIRSTDADSNYKIFEGDLSFVNQILSEYSGKSNPELKRIMTDLINQGGVIR
ncbi:MAG TPA: type II toxin-antitoxin system MqsA family antitoxin, partial [Petrotogaceae bacterium]|nr:type II toxin-antitoxin system MqsA family antitoxin [Petrotogaceae bacterium]